MRVVDPFAGLRGWTTPWEDAGHDVTTNDLGVDGAFDVDFRLDILDVASLADLERGRGPFDVVLASPPCTAFSVAAMGKNWERHATRRVIVGPKLDRLTGLPLARPLLGMRIAAHTFDLIDRYRAEHPGLLYVVENPIGALRVMPFVAGRRDRVTTWYCQWGERRAKPTDLWTNIRGDWPACRQGGTDHDAAPRGAKTGTQGLADAKTRSLIPRALAEAVMRACLDGGNLPSVRSVAAVQSRIAL